MRITVGVLLALAAAGADLSIEDLVREAGIREGTVAVRDRQNWRDGGHRILVTRVSDADLESMRAVLPETVFIPASSAGHGRLPSLP